MTTGQASVGMVARTTDDEATSPSNRQRLAAYAFAQELCIGIIGPRVPCNDLPQVVHRFAPASEPLEFVPLLFGSFARVHLRHGIRVVP